MLKKTVLLALGASSLFAFHMAELNINDKDFEAKLRFDMGQFNESVMPDTTFFGIGYIKGSEDHSDFHQADGLVEANFLMQRNVGNSENLTLGLGIKYEYSNIDDEDFSAIPLGIEARYRLPFDTGIPIYIGGIFYYSPEVLTFNDAKNFVEYRANVDLEIIERGHLVAGYRNIDLNFEEVDMNYNNSWYLGFRFQF
jgi:hypothetical protein